MKTTPTNPVIRLHLIAFIAVYIFSAASLNAVTITSADELGKWLSAQPDNTKDAPYTVILSVSDLGGSASTPESVGFALLRYVHQNKYVSLDLSGSTFTSIGSEAFYDCTILASITISDSVTSIGKNAFGVVTISPQ